MLGAIAGDTIGSVYEFLDCKDYDFQLFTPGSIYTDDSIMSFAVAEWLIHDPDHTSEELERRIVHYGEKYPYPKGGYGSRFSDWLDGEYVDEDGRRVPYNSLGNGSAMRVSACGWFFDTLEETERVAGISAAITHNHPEGIEGAQAAAACIWMARNGKTKEEIRDYVETKYGYDLHRSWSAIQPGYKYSERCSDTVPEAIISFLDSSDFEDAVRRAVSLGGDADTLACITGGIAEAFYGSVPAEIAEKVEGLLPDEFKEDLDWMRKNTAYGPR